MSVAMKGRSKGLLGLALVALSGAVSWAADAPTARRGFTIPYYEDLTVLKAVFTGQSAQAFPDGTVLATDFAATTVNDGRRDRPEFTVSAPTVLFNQSAMTASSTGAVRFATADGNFVLTGEGFLWQQKESLLFLSNNVVTIVVDPDKDATAPVRIRSERLRFDHTVRTGTYDGAVRVDSTEFALTGGELAVSMTASNTLDRLTARRDVVFTDLLEKATANADFADYQERNGERILELDGQPRWQDAFRRGRADHYTINRTARTLLATGNAFFRLPEESMSQPGGLLEASGLGQSPTNFVEITASRIFAALEPSTNQLRRFLAETNVVIATTDGRGRSTADRAEYLGNTGDLVLDGRRAEIRRDDSLVLAEQIRINRLTGSVAARTNAFIRLRLPVSAEQAGRYAVSTNALAELDADTVQTLGDELVAEGRVKGRVLENGALAGTLDTRRLAARFDPGRTARHIDALGEVVIHQFPVNGRTNFLSKELLAEHLEADISADKTLEKLVADQGLRVEQREAATAGTTNVTIAGARVAQAWFGPLSSLERFVAQREVHVRKGADYVHGDRAVYQATNRVGLLELTGDPVAVQRGMMITNATSLIYHEKTEKVSASGRFNIVPVATNSPARAVP